MAGQAQGREESIEGVDEGSPGSLLTHDHTRTNARQVDAPRLQDVSVAA